MCIGMCEVFVVELVCEAHVLVEVMLVYYVVDALCASWIVCWVVDYDEMLV